MEKLTLGLSTTAIGMLVVFFGLVILILCIYGMTSITGRQKKTEATRQASVPAAPQEPAPEVSYDDNHEEDDEQVVAAIAGALAMIWQSEGRQEGGFIVRRIRRIQTSTARARAARDEQIYSRL